MSDSIRFFDRIGRRWSTAPPTEALSGQCLVHGGGSLARVPIGPHALIVDDGEDTLDVAAPSLSTRLRVLQGENDASLDATLEVAAQVEQWEELGASWRDIVTEVPPLIQAAGVSQRLGPDRLEATFDDRLPELRHVFLSPFTELQFDSERLPVARARRVSRRATQVLAARTEDWLRVGAGGVTPRRIESLVRDEVVDLYENRVAARLLDEIRRHLKRTLALYAQLDELVGHEVSGWWRQERRLYELWGSQPPGADLRALLLQRRSHIERLLLATARLRDGRLYQEVPTRARVEQPIRITNLLADDPNYRGLRQVWVEWWRSRGDKESPDERRADRLRQTAAFDTFAWLTLVHAMSRMEDPLVAQSEAAAPTDVTARTPWGDVGLRSVGEQGEAAWSLWVSVPEDDQAPDDRALIIPLGCELMCGNETSVRSRLHVLDASTADHASDLPMVVLYPGTGRDLRSLPRSLQHEANRIPPLEHPSASKRDLWIIPISPLDLESIERVERAVRWVVLGTALSHYPKRAEFPDGSKSLLEGAGFLEASGSRNHVAVLREPRANEWEVLRHRVEGEVRRLDTLPRHQGAHEAADLRAGLERLSSAIGRLEPLARCPVCFGRGHLLPRSAATYEVTCQGCRSRWGLRHDPNAGARIPYLWIADEGSSTPSGLQIERWLGRDVLSSPCVHADAPYGTEIINPWSGRCTAPAALSTSCERCGNARLGGASSVESRPEK